MKAEFSETRLNKICQTGTNEQFAFQMHSQLLLISYLNSLSKGCISEKVTFPHQLVYHQKQAYKVFIFAHCLVSDHEPWVLDLGIMGHIMCPHIKCKIHYLIWYVCLTFAQN